MTPDTEQWLRDAIGDIRVRLGEIRVETPGGPWTVRLASLISDAPAGLLWDTEGLLVVKYGFHAYAFEARTGVLRFAQAQIVESAR